ncbi:hypothetical protein K440DRAFT_646017 [Wilcoxina mikolae CBS 423.85]|nr:hypothetical protein K440DRAFT_646017 [Wilcoxina mikolae CBS 423.85]
MATYRLLCLCFKTKWLLQLCSATGAGRRTYTVSTLRTSDPKINILSRSLDQSPIKQPWEPVQVIFWDATSSSKAGWDTSIFCFNFPNHFNNRFQYPNQYVPVGFIQIPQGGRSSTRGHQVACFGGAFIGGDFIGGILRGRLEDRITAYERIGLVLDLPMQSQEFVALFVRVQTCNRRDKCSVRDEISRAHEIKSTARRDVPGSAEVSSRLAPCGGGIFGLNRIQLLDGIRMKSPVFSFQMPLLLWSTQDGDELPDIVAAGTRWRCTS